MDEHDKLMKAKQKVEQLTGFYIHLAIFVLVMAILAIVNAAAVANAPANTNPGWWVQWPLIGWGAGVIGHYFLAFGDGSNFLRNWQLRKIKEMKERM